ncbi:hypothetical protein B7468_06960 [Staphylococcus lugdunensis]|nr:hypothetical protein B7468_06960 [Staphylococcus lugdunensis]
MLVAFLFESLFVGAPHPNLLCLLNFFSKFSLLGPSPQLALFGEMRFAFLSVRAPVKDIFVLAD